MTTVDGQVSASSLASAAVLVVGNAWGGFTPDEIEAIRTWVEGGGGLMLVGLGWSWPSSHPGETMQAYPMNALAAPFGARWLQSFLFDPTDQEDGSPAFHTFYPLAHADWQAARWTKTSEATTPSSP